MALYTMNSSRKFKPRRKRRTAGQEALKKVNEILKMSELKDFTTSNNNLININWNGQLVVELNNPPIGGTDITREGDQIACTYQELKITVLKPPGTGVDGQAYVRVIGFWDRQNTIVDQQEIINTLGTINAVNNVFNIDHRKEWILLYDKTVELNDLSKPMARFVFKTSLKKRLTQFSAGTENINSGALKFLIISDIDEDATNKPAYTFVSQCRYRDF